MKTLAQYLAENAARHVIDHALRASVDIDGKVTFYIHPNSVEGETLDFEANGNVLQAVTYPEPQDFDVRAALEDDQRAIAAEREERRQLIAEYEAWLDKNLHRFSPSAPWPRH